MNHRTLHACTSGAQVASYICALIVVAGSVSLLSGQTAKVRRSFAITAEIVSPVVMASVITSSEVSIPPPFRNPGEPTPSGKLELLVLWRGSPAWFRRGRQGTSGGGSEDTVHENLHYGDLDLRIEFKTSSRTLLIQEKAVDLPANANVVLVDAVDSVDGPRIVKTVAASPPATGERPLWPALRSSEELISFLRCDIKVEDSGLQRAFDRICAQAVRKQVKAPAGPDGPSIVNGGNTSRRAADARASGLCHREAPGNSV